MKFEQIEMIWSIFFITWNPSFFTILFSRIKLKCFKIVEKLINCDSTSIWRIFLARFFFEKVERVLIWIFVISVFSAIGLLPKIFGLFKIAWHFLISDVVGFSQKIWTKIGLWKYLCCFNLFAILKKSILFGKEKQSWKTDFGSS